MKTIALPEDLNGEGEFIRDILRQAVESSRVAKAKDIILVIPDKQFGGGEVVPILLLLGSNASVWLTRKWLDEVLWPIIKTKIDKPTRRIVEDLARHIITSEKDD